jgi:hypothetical protein
MTDESPEYVPQPYELWAFPVPSQVPALTAASQPRLDQKVATWVRSQTDAGLHTPGLVVGWLRGAFVDDDPGQVGRLELRPVLAGGAVWPADTGFVYGTTRAGAIDAMRTLVAGKAHLENQPPEQAPPAPPKG